MKKHFIFFDLGQTLVNEWNFIEYFDIIFLDTLNDFGSKIDMRNYRAVRDNVIISRKIGQEEYIQELIIEVCKLISQPGYDRIIAKKLEPEIRKARRRLLRLFEDTIQTISILSKNYDLGIIANQSDDILDLLKRSDINRFFKVNVISSEVKMKKPDLRIFLLAMDRAACKPEDCIMVGDRLDTDIHPANELGMKTIRTTRSLFKLQTPLNELEQPTHSVVDLSSIFDVVDKHYNIDNLSRGKE
jgi:HAD superfamily hydrolase (TIGR01662 family)